MTRPILELRPGQHLTLTPQLQQSIRLLQLSTLDLEAEISQVLADNPLLEREDDTPAAEAQAESNANPRSMTTPRSGTRCPVEEMPGSGGVYSDDDSGLPEAARPDTLREHLLGQLMLTRAAPRDAALAALLIDELDENGYLGSPLEEILTWLPAEMEPDLDELRAALSLLQSFDPVGIGARDMADCLVLQLRHPTSPVCPKRPIRPSWPAPAKSVRAICPCWPPVTLRACALPWAATRQFSARPTR